jgi:chromosomal replication initiation ATPase DnaA
MIKVQRSFAIAAEVMEEAGRLFGVSPWLVVRAGNKRTAKLVQVRWAVIWVLRQLVDGRGRRVYSALKVAAVLRYADHTTVLHGCREAEFLRARNPDFRAKCDQLLAFVLSLREA